LYDLQEMKNAQLNGLECVDCSGTRLQEAVAVERRGEEEVRSCGAAQGSDGAESRSEGRGWVQERKRGLVRKEKEEQREETEMRCRVVERRKRGCREEKKKKKKEEEEEEEEGEERKEERSGKRGGREEKRSDSKVRRGRRVTGRTKGEEENELGVKRKNKGAVKKNGSLQFKLLQKKKSKR
jgi:hypothetical protein